MGRDRGLSVETMIEIHFFKKTNILVVALQDHWKVPVLHGAETRQIESCFTLQL